MATSGSYNTNVITVNSSRGLVFTWRRTAVSITGNYSDISWELKGSNHSGWMNGQPFSQTVDGSTSTKSTLVKVQAGTLILSGTKRIYHNSDGSASFSANTVASLYYYSSNNVTGSGSWALDAIPRASTITTFDNFTIGNNVPWAVDKKSTSYSHKVELLVGGTVITTANTTEASGTFTITAAMKNAMLNATPNSKTVVATLRVTTLSGSTTIGAVQTKNATATVGNDIVPTISSISVSELNGNVETKIGSYVKGLTSLRLVMNGATAGYGSSIQTYIMTVAGYTINAASGNTGIIYSSGTITITSTLTDTRGFSTSLTKDITVLDYSPPTIENVSFVRCDSLGTIDPLGSYVKVTFNGSVSSLIVGGVEKNKLNYKIQSKKTNESTYSVKTNVDASGLTYSGSTMLSGYEIDYAFNIIASITDEFSTSSSAGIVAIGQVLQHWGDKSTAFGMLLPGTERNVYVGRGGLKSHGIIEDMYGNEVRGGIQNPYPVGSIYISVNNTNPSSLFGGTWIAFATGRTLVGVDTSQTEFNTVKKTGGHKELQAHTHTLTGTTNTTGNHSHTVDAISTTGTVDNPVNQGTYYVFKRGPQTTSTDGNHSHTVSGTANSTGGGNSGNLQPYITVYMWQRTG